MTRTARRSATVTTLPGIDLAPAVAPQSKRTRRPVADRPAGPSPAARRRDMLARRAGLIPAGIFAAGLALSLAHQAHGVIASTTVAGWEGWATAVTIDLGFLAAKGLPYLARNDAERAALSRWLTPVAVACFALCAWFNSAGYTGFAPSGYARAIVGVVLGCFVPGVMLAMSQAARILLVPAKG